MAACSKAHRQPEQRSLQVYVVAERLSTGRIGDVEAAVADLKSQRGVPDIIEGADDFPIGMRGDAEAADIAIGGQPEPTAKFAMIAGRDQGIGPAARTADRLRRHE